jgi:ParB family chromosome partitioning protein
MATATTKKTTAPRKTAAKKAAAKWAPTAATPELRFELVPHDLIDLNLDNVRHEIVQDDALLALGENIRTQGLSLPLLLHPHPDEPGRYVLIDGHRRHVSVGLQANPPAMPSLIRPPYNSRAELIAAMLGTYLHNQDLSPVEEAEAYEAMALDGLDDDAIAEMTSVGPRRVKERRRLLGLRPEHQAQLHTGQLTLDTAAALIEFADDAAALVEIERALRDGGAPQVIKNAIASSRARREREVLAKKTAAALKKAKIKVLAQAPDHGGSFWRNPYRLGQAEGLPVSREQHEATDCKSLAAVIGWASDMDSIEWYCLDPTAHGRPMPGQTDAIDEAAVEEARREREAEQAALDEQAEACDAARIQRRDHLTSLISGSFQFTDEMAEALTKHTVMISMGTYLEVTPDNLATWLGLSEEVVESLDDTLEEGQESPIREEIERIPAHRALLALMAADGEDGVKTVHDWQPRRIHGARRAWLNLLGGPLGYEWTEWEAARLAVADAFAAANQRKLEACRVCGCTEAEACDGGCSWTEPGLCSECTDEPATVRPVETVPTGGVL